MARKSRAVKTISSEVSSYSLRRTAPAPSSVAAHVGGPRGQSSPAKSTSSSMPSTSRTVASSPSKPIQPKAPSPPHRIIVSRTTKKKRAPARAAKRPNPLKPETAELGEVHRGSSKLPVIPVIRNQNKEVSVTQKGGRYVKPLKRLQNANGVERKREEAVEEAPEQAGEAQKDDADDSDDVVYPPPNRNKIPQYVVEKIVDKRYVDGNLEYKIRWSGYKPSDDSWTPVKDCNCTWAIRQFEKDFRGKVKKVSSEKKNQPKSDGKLGRPMKRSKGDSGAATSKKKQKTHHEGDAEEAWEDTFSLPDDNRPTASSMPPPLLIPSRKKPIAKKPKRAVAKGKSKSKNQKSQKLRVQPVKPFAVPWNILSEKTVRTIPQLYRNRLDKNEMPLKIVNAKNAPVRSTEEAGYQRYCCEWADGMSCWVPGKLCCKIVPKVVIAYGLHQLPVQENFIKTLLDSAFDGNR